MREEEEQNGRVFWVYAIFVSYCEVPIKCYGTRKHLLALDVTVDSYISCSRQRTLKYVPVYVSNLYLLCLVEILLSFRPLNKPQTLKSGNLQCSYKRIFKIPLLLGRYVN